MPLGLTRLLSRRSDRQPEANGPSERTPSFLSSRLGSANGSVTQNLIEELERAVEELPRNSSSALNGVKEEEEQEHALESIDTEQDVAEEQSLESYAPGPSARWDSEDDSDTEATLEEPPVNMKALTQHERHLLSKKLQALVVWDEATAILLMCKWRNVDINVADATGLTALHTAAAEGKLSTLQALLDMGADVHAQDIHGAQPVHYAAAAGSPSKLAALCNAGADLDAVTHNGFTALCWAAQRGHLSVVRALVGPMMAVTMSWPDNDDAPVPGATALGLALAKGHVAVARELLLAGCDVAQKAMGFTALHVAVSQELPAQQMEDMVRMLVRDVRVSLHAVQQETGMTAAHSAAESGSVAALRALRRFGADLAKKDKLGRLPLHVAAGMGHTTAVTELVRVLGVPVQARDALRHSALHWAAMSGHDTTVEQLVRLGAKLHSRSTTGRMALHQAAENGRASTVALLRRLGADSRAVDEYQCTPMQLAVVRGHADVVRALHAAGDQLEVVNEHGRTFVHYAAEFGHMEVLEFLLQHVPNPMRADHTGCTPTIAAAANGRMDALLRMVKLVREGSRDGVGDSDDEAGGGGERWSPARAANGPLAPSSSKESPVSSEKRSPKKRRASRIALIASDVSRREWRELALPDAQGNTALHWAAAGGHVSAAKVLMHQAHLRLEAKNNEGRSVLMVAVQHRQLAMVMLLVKLGADVRTAANSGLTALMQAAALADVAMMELLMQRGASLRCMDAMGRTALHMAAGADDALPVVRHLLRLKMDVHKADDEGITPMHCACGRASLEVVKLLKEKGADITAVTKDGRSMLHMAACNPDATVLQALIQWGVPPDSKKAHGQSVLHVAAWKGHLAVVEALLESASGPDMLQCVDDLGRSPLHWAVAHGHVAVVRALIAHGLDPLRRDLMGATLLHVAVLRGHTELVNTLLAQGVDPNAVDRYGSTAAELATKPEINLLLQKDHEKRKKEQLEREMDAVDQMLHSSTGISLKLSFGSFKGMTAGVTSAIEHKGVHGAVGLMKKTAMNLFTRGAAKNLRAGRMALDDSGGPTQQVASPRIEEGGDTKDSDYELCLLCLSREKSMRTLPCRHTCICSECAIELQGGAPCGVDQMPENFQCPVCRGPVSSIAPVF